MGKCYVHDCRREIDQTKRITMTNPKTGKVITTAVHCTRHAEERLRKLRR